MHLLIVLAHPDRRSFNGRLVDRALDFLPRLGHTVEVSDLYRQDFDAREAAWHYPRRKDQDYFDVQAEQLHASDRQDFPLDVRTELARLQRADLVILQYPMWWFAAPALMKGWIDRVLVYGQTYTSAMRYERGHLQGKRAMVSITLGGPESSFAHDGRNGDIDLLLWPMHMSLRYVGLDVLPPFKAFGVNGSRSDPAGELHRQSILDAYEQRLRAIGTTAPLRFNGGSDWDEHGRLLPHAASHSLAVRHHP